ncbi:MAG: Fe2+-dependent dioxygenase [Prochlorothrix sp.]
MIVYIEGVLDPTTLTDLDRLLQTAEFQDGKLTAGTFAKTVKHNTQLQGGTETMQAVRDLIHPAIEAHPLFQAVARPQAIRPCLINRYEAGMSYGWHTDNALMGTIGDRTRSDLSFTLFLSDPDRYEGGELILDTDLGEKQIKLAAGSLVLYPSTFLHRVAEVRSGCRLAAVSWVQSLVRHAHQRTILFDLDTVRRSIFQKYGKTEEFDLLSKTHTNLLRHWAEV